MFDPIEMARVVRNTPKPCLVFKILAAGRRCWSAASLDEAFKFAYGNIKNTDTVTIGVFTKRGNQIEEDTTIAREILGTPVGA